MSNLKEITTQLASLNDDDLAQLSEVVEENRASRAPQVDIDQIKPGMSAETRAAAMAAIAKAQK